jgi:hypothetical protein
VVGIVASEDAIRARLAVRSSRVSARDVSEADAAVYAMMRERQQEPTGPYLTVDTDGELERGLERVEEAIRLAST